ncbi:efflux RND transporter periplasmic adaptor subunit [Azonexus sp.]|uniref:efflux RND transporter periplasmic adaptor subunit n=1 Tax=Azonexus sp. TaxID=1872668 RepID=UPI0027B93AFC|nr:efflux RND transporter periplasmic adaptor subunit [Azonexus sp.]
MNNQSTRLLLVRTASHALFALAAFALAGCGESAPTEAAKTATQPALTVTLVSPKKTDWPQTLAANGNVAAWQEAAIGAEVANTRIAEVLVQVGDTVGKGQVLARIDASTLASELAEAQAAVLEQQAAASEARGNAARARDLQARGFYSQQMNSQYQSAEQTSAARLAAARARLQSAQLRLDKTQVVAPDAGVISAKSATAGSLTQPGQELFRLIRGGRLEWRAELPSADFGKLKVGTLARLTGPSGETVEGKVRSLAPSVDPQTRNGLVYVDLPASTAASAVKAGMFARGEFDLGASPALAVPQASVVLREGFAYVYRLEGEDRVAQTKVVPGRRQGDLLEIVDGLPADARIVASGAGFLADGDRVRIVADGAK